jgi:hypothetical protein
MSSAYAFDGMMANNLVSGVQSIGVGNSQALWSYRVCGLRR